MGVLPSAVDQTEMVKTMGKRLAADGDAEKPDLAAAIA